MNRSRIALVIGGTFALLSACATVSPQTWTNTWQGGGEDAFVTDDAFKCLKSLTKVGNTYYDNVNGHLEETLAVARNPQGGAFPVGTIVSLQPGEAMVKRAAGFSPGTYDWEFFKIKVVDGKSVITERGTTEMKNIAGSCVGCHEPAAKQFDLVCATGHGCKPLPGFVQNMALKSAEKDERCE